MSEVPLYVWGGVLKGIETGTVAEIFLPAPPPTLNPEPSNLNPQIVPPRNPKPEIINPRP